jgi:O-antigen/teichoic acid export membrane protein
VTATSSGNQAGLFTGRVAVLFGTQVIGSVIAVVNGILLARLLGPAGRGDYSLLLLLPSTAMALTLLGLPQALGYFTAKGRAQGLVTKSFWLTAFLTLAAFVAVLALLPALRESILPGIDVSLIFLAFVALPLGLSATFTTGIVMGRQAVRWKAAVSTIVLLATTVLIVVILGGLGPSVEGAIVVYLLANGIGTLGFAIGAIRVTRGVGEGPKVSYRELLRYGLPLYPASLTVFLNYRADVYLIAWLLADPSEPLGYYSMAVALAELVFFFPDAVSVLFFPHVAGSVRDDSDRQVALVARVTLIATLGFALLMVPAAYVLITLVLPAFGPSIPVLLVLLPGVVALSVPKVIGGYMIGIARPDIVSAVSVASFVVNVLANLVLIPPFGIIGAAAASLVSYSFSALLTTAIAARLARTSLVSFFLPRPADVCYVLAVFKQLSVRAWTALLALRRRRR